MSRILVMEDHDDLRADLIRRIRQELPFVRIEAHDRIEVGVGLIRAAAHRNMPFDAAVLDFKLNSDDALRDQKIDEVLCHEIRRLMHQCMVLHVTGHAGDRSVIAHVERCHSGVREPRSRVIPKENDYVGRAVREVALWVCTKPVHEILDCLFCSPRFHAGVGVRAHLSSISASHLLARLEHWVTRYWTALDPSTQSRVLRHFDRSGTRFVLRDSTADGAGA